ncbi:MAG: class I SAM-dependent DNA methyltransferase [Candidatus Dormibacteraceae bacterium]
MAAANPGPSLRELAREALSSTEQGYDLLAPKFDASPFRTPDRLLDAVLEALRRDAPWDRGLDLCCGTGAGMRVLAPLCARITGLDRSRGMLEQARRRHGDLARWVRADALELPFEQAFDLIVTFGALGHILPGDETRFLDGVWRALRPGGIFCLVTAPMPPLLSPTHVLARGFNAVMHVRNALWSPPFVMYYLTFLLPQVTGELRRQGFSVEVRALPQVPSSLRLVLAHR